MKLKHVLIFAAGFGIGFTGCYFLLKDKFEKECQERNNEFKKEYSNAKEKRKEEVSKMVEKASKQEKIFNNVSENPKSSIDLGSIKQMNTAQVAYGKIATDNGYLSNESEETPLTAREKEEAVKESEVEEEDDDSDILAVSLHPVEGPSDEPYSISAAQFAEECLWHDKVTLIFWDDGILTDDNEEIVTDYSRLIGYDFASEIGKFEEGVAYIRNEKVGSDYEILAEHQSYMDTVMHN